MYMLRNQEHACHCLTWPDDVWPNNILPCQGKLDYTLGFIKYTLSSVGLDLLRRRRNQLVTIAQRTVM